MPPLFYPSFQALSLFDVLIEEIAGRTEGYTGRLGAAWYWRMAGGTLVTFRLDYTVTEERWDVLRAQATNPRAGMFNSADFPFIEYCSSLTSPPFIHDLQGVAQWSNRLYFNTNRLIGEAVQWLNMLNASILNPHVGPPAAFPYLNEIERDLVRYTLDELDGRFNLAQLYDVFGERISRRRLRSLAQDWEGLGLLTPHPRRITYALRSLFEVEEE